MRKRLRDVQLESVANVPERKRLEGRDGVDPAAAEQHQARARILAEFQHISQTDQVVLEQPAAAEAALNARQHAGLSGGFDHPVGGGQRFEVAGLPEVAMENRDAHAPQAQPVALRSRAHQVIDAGDGKARPPLEKSLRYGAADESTDARDQKPHQTSPVSRRIQLAAISWKMAGSG